MSDWPLVFPDQTREEHRRYIALGAADLEIEWGSNEPREVIAARTLHDPRQVALIDASYDRKRGIGIGHNGV